MCWSPKIKTPSVDTNKIRAVDPAPLTEEPKGVLFGGDGDDDATEGTSSEVSGRKDLKVKKTTTAPKATSPKASIRKAFTS